MKDIYNKFVYAGIDGDERFETLFDELDVGVDNVVENRGIQVDEQTLESLYNFGFFMISQLRGFLGNTDCREYCFALKTPPHPPAGAVYARPYSRFDFYRGFRRVFEDLITEKATVLMLKARQYEDGQGESFHVGENSKTATSGTTRTTSQNTTGANGTARQRFTNGATTNSSGVSN